MGINFSPRPKRHKLSHIPLLILSLVASVIVIFSVQYYASEDGIEMLESSAAAAIVAPWGPEDGNADVVRQAAVRNAMIHAWHGYEKYAWGADELRPQSLEGKFGVLGGMNGFSGMGASIVDAMSTLYIMGLYNEFERAHAWIAENMSFVPQEPQKISFFETTIRLLGGLLAAHDLSGHRLFLDKATDLGTRLLPVFDGTSTGLLINSAELPITVANPADENVLLAEAGSNLIEFGTLAARTDNDIFREKAENGMRFLHAKFPNQPLLGTSVSRKTGQVADTTKTVGAPVDSYFEYLLKYWILRGKRDNHWRDRWINATDMALNELVITPPNRNFSFTGEVVNGLAPRSVITHLGCFFPGNIALGVMSGAVEGERAEKYLTFARSMMEACYQLYNTTDTGLGADQIMVDSTTGVMSIYSAPYLQRPEVVESLFYLWRATHDELYREWGWSIVQAIEKYCRKPGGYSGVLDVGMNRADIAGDDTQQSWFLAETLKYLYLLFSDDNVVRLDEWVFNTEAHPMRVQEEEKEEWLDWDWLFPRFLLNDIDENN